jgi:S-adenosylmethionine:tRNA ribosyltransferase-isomerase
VQISDFDYDLPQELIAQAPLAQRDASRMLVLDRREQTFRDSVFASLSNYLRANDVLVLNNTRVFPARLIGEREPSGGSVEVLLLREIEPYRWQVLARPGRRLRPTARISFGGSKLRAEVLEVREDGTRVIGFEPTADLHTLIDEFGRTPLPPYIKRSADETDQDRVRYQTDQDRVRYQTVYARERGAIAAPTAGLHFTPDVLRKLADSGVKIAEITLHVGYGTFEPVRVKDVAQHAVAPEHFHISPEAAESINQAPKLGGRIVCVGTTSARALESAARRPHQVKSGAGVAGLTIVPGYQFQIVDALLTNFHLPQSSLLLLVSGFAGRELVLRAYRHAVIQRYRFYSYGDCMFIF